MGRGFIGVSLAGICYATGWRGVTHLTAGSSFRSLVRAVIASNRVVMVTPRPIYATSASSTNNDKAVALPVVRGVEGR